MTSERTSTLVFASKNIRKIAELKKLLADKFPRVTFLSLLDFPKLELPPLNTPTLKLRSESKAEFVAKATGHIADSGGTALMSWNQLSVPSWVPSII